VPADAVTFARPAPRSALVRAVLRAGAGTMPGLVAARRTRRLRGDVAAGMAEDAGQAALPAIPEMPASYRYDPDLSDRGMSRLTRAVLDRCDPWATRAARRRNWQQLADAVAGMPGLALLHRDLPPDVSPTGLALRVPDRAAMMVALARQGVAATPWWAGAHPDLDPSACPEAVALKAQVMVLPIHQQLGAAAMDRTAAALRAV